MRQPDVFASLIGAVILPVGKAQDHARPDMAQDLPRLFRRGVGVQGHIMAARGGAAQHGGDNLDLSLGVKAHRLPGNALIQQKSAEAVCHAAKVGKSKLRRPVGHRDGVRIPGGAGLKIIDDASHKTSHGLLHDLCALPRTDHRGSGRRRILRLPHGGGRNSPDHVLFMRQVSFAV